MCPRSRTVLSQGVGSCQALSQSPWGWGAAVPAAAAGWGLGQGLRGPVLPLPLAPVLLPNPSTAWTSCPAPGLPPSAPAWPKLLSTAGCWALQGSCLVPMMVRAGPCSGRAAKACSGTQYSLTTVHPPHADLLFVGAPPTTTLQPLSPWGWAHPTPHSPSPHTTPCEGAGSTSPSAMAPLCELAPRNRRTGISETLMYNKE